MKERSRGLLAFNCQAVFVRAWGWHAAARLAPAPLPLFVGCCSLRSRLCTRMLALRCALVRPPARPLPDPPPPPPQVRWITFHSGYDFGYLLKLLTCQPLPASETAFFELLRVRSLALLVLLASLLALLVLLSSSS